MSSTSLYCESLVLAQVTDNPIMVYMKGTPAAPACGFSMQVSHLTLLCKSNLIANCFET
jgi:glutaredoxin-related protein